MKTMSMHLLVMLLVVTTLAGCPWRRGNIEFTSADMGVNYPGGFTGIAADGSREEAADGGERELIEPDVIRRHNNLLYILNQYRGLAIVDLYTETMLSQTPLLGRPRDLYLVGKRAYVLVSCAQDVHYGEFGFHVFYSSRIYVLNITDPAKVVIEGVSDFEGDLVDSRLVGDVIYVVCSDYTWYEGISGGDVVMTDAARKSYGSVKATSFNIANPVNITAVDTLSFPGHGNLIQATNYAIFSVTSDWDSTGGATSYINYIDITDPQGKITLRGVATAPGYMTDRFKMDAWENVLRVVTNTGWPEQETYITTFDIANPDQIRQLGQTMLADASGETLFATRFDGPRAYIVTYFMVDPLFVIDLSDPANPQVKGELKVPGWSTHIEPLGDRLIALGVDDKDGGRRVMVSLFDVGDPGNPQRLAYESFGDDWAWSSAYHDVKAFTITEDMLLIPFSGWNDTGGYDRLQFLSYTRDTLDTRGHVDLQGSALRSFGYEGLYYAVTQEQLAVIDSSNIMAPFIAAAVPLAENLVDTAPLPNGWLVEVVSRNDSRDTVLYVSEPISGAVGNAVSIAVSNVTDTFVWHNALVLVGEVYEYEPEYNARYHVYLVDYRVPQKPVLRREWQVDMQPWWGWGWYYPAMEVDAIRRGKTAKQYWNIYGGDAKRACMEGDFLLLRGVVGDYDRTLGEAEPLEGAALIDVADEESLVLVGLGYEQVVDIKAAEGQFYITGKIQAGNDRQRRSLCAYYLHILNPATQEVENTYNVPGIFRHLLPETNYLLFEDHQYTDEWNIITLARCVEVTKKKVRVLNSLAMPSGYWDIAPDGSNLWYCGHHDAYEDEQGADGTPVSSDSNRLKQDGAGAWILGKYTVDESGAFTHKQELTLGPIWCDLLNVKNNQAYISVQSAALAHCNFDLSPPAVEEIIPITGYPRTIRFSTNNVYISLGYNGLTLLPLL